MVWLYSLDVDQTEELKASRRRLLDSYGQFAQLSVLLIPLFYQLSLAVRLIVGRCLPNNSRGVVKDHLSPLPSARKKQATHLSNVSWERLRWASGEEIVREWGTWQHWLFALSWAAWLLILIFKDTGDDYIHLTRRFAIVAASQLPIHYVLAMKAWSPVQYVARMSHEELNPYHRLLGRIIVALMGCHASLYINFYVQKGFLSKRLQDRDVILGLSAISSAVILFTTALARFRKYSYRLFFTIHVILSIALLPILYFHVSHIRIYILEAAAIAILLVVQRNVSQIKVEATINRLKETDLLSIVMPATALGSRFSAPGQHIYIAFPTLKDKLRLNPFTVASLPDQDRKIRIVARTLTGTTSMLDQKARNPQPTSLLIEGPYGAVNSFPPLADYDSVLLVAGGVGATFTIPIYRQLLRNHSGEGRLTSLRFVWTVRDQRDATWGMESLMSDSETLPDGFELYVTGRGRRSHANKSKSQDDGMEIELQEREGLLDDDDDDNNDDDESETIGGRLGSTCNIKNGRPAFGPLVDQIFTVKGGDKIAILVCGPSGMGAALRKEVGRWIATGQEVFWHNEEFGW